MPVLFLDLGHCLRGISVPSRDQEKTDEDRTGTGYEGVSVK